jgi:tetratricopeptide (TPR) repeat protein
MPKKGQDHLSETQLRSLFRGELSSEEARLAVRHLLSQCRQCVALAGRVGSAEGFLLYEASLPPISGYHDLFLTILRSGTPEDIVRARERLRGLGLLAELESYPVNERLSCIRRDRRFHSWGLFDRILAKYLEYSRNDPWAGVELVYLALAVVETLDPRRYPEACRADLRASALAALSNAKRLAGSFDDARATLRTAWEHLERGTGDPLGEANIISMEASLIRDLGRFEEAAALLNRALDIYREMGDSNACAKVLIKQANAIGYSDPAKAIPLLQDALALLDSAEEPRLELCARHNLVWFLNDDGRVEEALTFLELSRPLYKAFSDSWTQLRLHWIEARLERSLGDLAEAEATLRKLWFAFEERQFVYEQTLISIELSEVYCSQGKWSEAMRLVEEFYPVLEGWGMHREGLAFWILFRESLLAHAQMKVALDVAAFRSAELYYHRAWRHPLGTIETSRAS